MKDIRFPVAESMSREVLSLPLGPHLSVETVEEISVHVKRILEFRGI